MKGFFDESADIRKNINGSALRFDKEQKPVLESALHFLEVIQDWCRKKDVEKQLRTERANRWRNFPPESYFEVPHTTEIIKEKKDVKK